MEKVSIRKSSHIKNIFYDSKTKEARIEFHKGGTYSYPDVSSRTISGFTRTPSVGGYFSRNMKAKIVGTKVK